MSATILALLLAAATATAVGVAALHAAHGLRKELTALRAELTASDRAQAARVPAARAAPESEVANHLGEVPLAEIRAAVADALTEERERELAEARAFWAAQESRDVADSPSLLGSLPAWGEDPTLDAALDAALDTTLYVPRQADFAGLEPLLGPDALRDALGLEGPGPDAQDPGTQGPPTQEPDSPADSPADDPANGPMAVPADAVDGEAAKPTESPGLAAARRRHPSHPDFSPTPAVADHERTVARLVELADAGTPLADVRPGPLGTLDVYVFADGTTVCMTPGHRETAKRLGQAVRDGVAPVLLGGSGISGGYTLTFGYGDESVFILADRVVASL